MSNLFERPKPEKATVSDVQKALDEITEWDWTTGYSFAHIVIDDHNLDNKSILHCLRPDGIAEVMSDKINDEFTFFGRGISDLEPWELAVYRQKIKHMAEIIDLLNWLLAVPEGIRDEVE